MAFTCSCHKAERGAGNQFNESASSSSSSSASSCSSFSAPAILLSIGLSKCSIADIGEVAAATGAIRQMQLGFGDAFVSGILSMPHRHSFSGLRLPESPLSLPEGKCNKPKLRHRHEAGTQGPTFVPGDLT